MELIANHLISFIGGSDQFTLVVGRFYPIHLFLLFYRIHPPLRLVHPPSFLSSLPSTYHLPSAIQSDLRPGPGAVRLAQRCVLQGTARSDGSHWSIGNDGTIDLPGGKLRGWRRYGGVKSCFLWIESCMVYECLWFAIGWTGSFPVFSR